jgi:hypothetical protein
MKQALNTFSRRWVIFHRTEHHIHKKHIYKNESRLMIIYILIQTSFSMNILKSLGFNVFRTGMRRSKLCATMTVPHSFQLDICKCQNIHTCLITANTSLL